jgi:hypothetical protein
MMVYGDGDFFFFYANMPEIPRPNHYEIQEFAKKKFHISAMKIKKCLFFNISTGVPH